MKFVSFINTGKTSLGKPVLAKNNIPDWYKKGEVYYYKSDCQDINCTGCEKTKNPGLKTCMPVFDALVSGYFLVTPVDIYVGKEKDNNLSINWNSPEDIASFIMERPEESGSTIPRPAGHLNNHFVWSGFWGLKTPRGYSLLVTHPLNRYDLPFTTMSGIMDSDKILVSGNVPFFIKDGFTGLIPEGTPYAQLIPIKRKRWQLIINNAKKDDIAAQTSKISSEEKYYKKFLWQKKEYL
jgi:hypothetical protein